MVFGYFHSLLWEDHIKFCCSFVIQPGSRLILLSLLFMSLGLNSFSLVWQYAAIAIVLIALFWQHMTSLSVGENFAALRSIPIIDGKPYYYLCQVAQKGAAKKRCRTLQYSLLLDKAALEQLPSGTYKTLTHDGVLNILKSCHHIQNLTALPTYKADLRPILRKQSGGQCRRCKKHCMSWNSPPRQFYFVSFVITNQ